MKLTAKKAASIVGGKLVSGDPGRTARGVSTDTRTMKPKDAFVALRGERFDGRDFARKALEAGAAWMLAEKGGKKVPAGLTLVEVGDALKALGDLAAYHLASHSPRVAAITGSVAKTTTKEMAAAILSGAGRTLKNEGNFNNGVGLPLTVFRLNGSHDFAVLEMGMNEPGEIARLVEIARPEVGLITRIAPAHLEGLGSIEGVARAKAEMINGLSGDSTFILNLDDRLIERKAKRFKGKIVGYSARQDAAFKGEWLLLERVEKEVRGGKPMVRFAISRRKGTRKTGKTVEFKLWTLSPSNAINALAACALAGAMGVSLQTASERLRGFKGVPGRGEVTRSKKGVLVINDFYNASPASVEDALETMKWWRGPMRGVAVLGSMLELGKDAEKYHRAIGKKAAETGVELLIARGPHSEAMVEAAIEAGAEKNGVMAVKDNGRAIEVLRRSLRGGDWVLVKGSRSMKMEEVARAIAG